MRLNVWTSELVLAGAVVYFLASAHWARREESVLHNEPVAERTWRPSMEGSNSESS